MVVPPSILLLSYCAAATLSPETIISAAISSPAIHFRAVFIFS